MTASFPPFDGEPITRSVGIAYVIFARPSIDRATEFLRDFGIDLLSVNAEGAHYGSAARQEVFYVVRREPKARFVGLGMYVDSKQDLQRLIEEGRATRVEPDLAPNGEPYVRMTDPSGFEVHAVVRRFDWHADHVTGTPNSLPTNTPRQTPRVNAPFSAQGSTPRVVRLGHVVMEAIDFRGAVAWYQQTFGMRVSDYQHLPDGTPVVAFCRCDLGDEPTDHHTIAIGQTFRVAFEHVAFEMEDIEAVTHGQHRLRDRGYKHSWGIGRHIMGSQIFDYWYDPYGTKHEHYADGDAVTATFPMGKSPFGPSYLAQWGPPMPANFVGGTLSPKVLSDLVRCVASGGLSLATIAALVKAAKFSDRRIGSTEASHREKI